MFLFIQLLHAYGAICEWQKLEVVVQLDLPRMAGLKSAHPHQSRGKIDRKATMMDPDVGVVQRKWVLW